MKDLSEEELVSLFKSGDHRRFGVLWERVRWYIPWSNYAVSGWYERQDLEIEAQRALWRAVLDYDSTRGIKFTTVAVKYMTNAILTMVAFERAGCRKGDVVSMDGFQGEDGEDVFEVVFFHRMLDRYKADPAFLREKIFKELLTAIRSQAEEQHIRILQVLDLLLEGRQAVEIAGILKLTKGRISQIVAKLRRIVSDVLEE